MPKLAAALALLASFAWSVLPAYSTHETIPQVSGPQAIIVLTIPVILSLWGSFAEGRERLAGTALLLFSLVVLFLSGIWLGLSYLPSSILLLVPPRCFRAHRNEAN